MHKYIKTLLFVLIVIISLSCCRPTEIYSSFELERKELLNSIQKMERIYGWYNIKTAIKYPFILTKGVFDRLPTCWRELKRHIRKGDYNGAYAIIEKDSFGILISLRYSNAREEFYEIAKYFHHHFRNTEDACMMCHELGRDIWFMMDYPEYGVDFW